MSSEGGEVDSSTVSTPSEVQELSTLKRKPHQPIRSEDWNRIVTELVSLREYVNNMSESVTLTGLVSHTGQSFPLDGSDSSENNYGVRAIGLITSQWVAPKLGTDVVICEFGVTDYFDRAQFWAAADNGDKNTLNVVLEYIDGTTSTVGENLFVNSRTNLTIPTGNNHYLEYLAAPKGYWYKYEIRNTIPRKEVRFIKFVNVNQQCVVRIGNVLHLRGRIKPLK